MIGIFFVRNHIDTPFARQNAQSCYDFSPVILGAKLHLCCERNLYLQFQNLRYRKSVFGYLNVKSKSDERKGQ